MKIVWSPLAIERVSEIAQYIANSVSLLLPHPSAIFVGIEAPARLIWLVNPYNSSRGKFDVALLIFKVKR